MATTHIVYETATGRVVLVHHYAGEPGDAEGARQDAVKLAELSEDQVAVVSVPADEIEATRLYRIDTDRKALVDAEAGEGGFGFSVTTVRAPAEGPGVSPSTSA